MTTTFDSISLKGLRLAHLRQLRTYASLGITDPKNSFINGMLIFWSGLITRLNMRNQKG